MEGAEAGRQGAMPPRLDVMSHLCMSEYRRGKGREGGTLACAPASDTFHCASSSCRGEFHQRRRNVAASQPRLGRSRGREAIGGGRGKEPLSAGNMGI